MKFRLVEAERAQHPFSLLCSLLEVTSEAELDRFLGALVERAGRVAGSVTGSPTAHALARALDCAFQRIQFTSD